MIQRIISDLLMLFFMVYQSQLKISELDLAKQGFQRFESQLYKLGNIWFYINVVFMTGCFVINDLFLNGNPSQRVAIAYTKHQLVNLIILFKAYFESSILIMSYMYKKHRYAFRTHARNKILLIAFTIISFVIIIFNQFLFGFWRFCKSEYEV